ncbi:TIGR01457 family HAD-type hydrolase [Abiotrophia defectiva]|uniref:TIGR01457 family HAD-type hydrolase n=1 Tax=Abiotrophia defectiva TaxID=46125 RepID=UPI0028D034CF|nr:TIGR01457 family HAD-type hydrolase [Abiotrophia defectiva]
MKDYAGYLIDLDGTVYFGKNRIPTAEAFIKKLVAQDIPFLFITNNATRSAAQVAQALSTQYELPVTEKHVYTSAMAIIDYLHAHHEGQTVYVVGEAPLKEQVAAAGFTLVEDESAQVVVQALDRHTTYEALSIAVLAIRNGAAFLVTNTDSNIPTERGMMPSSGALTSFIQYASQVEPVVMGKPFNPILEGGLHTLGLTKDQVLMIGDNYETDIKVGINAGMDTLLVLTGFTQEEDLKSVPVQPTYVRPDLSTWEL